MSITTLLWLIVFLLFLVLWAIGKLGGAIGDIQDRLADAEADRRYEQKRQVRLERGDEYDY